MRIRTCKKHYTVISNATVQSDSLSWGALGLLTYCLSMPEDWYFRPKEIWKRGRGGRAQIYRLFNELIEEGHCIRVKLPNENPDLSNLLAETVYEIFDDIESCRTRVAELYGDKVFIECRAEFRKSAENDPKKKVPSQGSFTDVPVSGIPVSGTPVPGKIHITYKETENKKTAAANACASARGAPAPAAAADAAAASFEDKKPERTETPLPASISPQENLRSDQDISRAPEACAAPSCTPPAKRSVPPPPTPSAKTKKPRVYACLVDVAIDDKDKIWITEKHEELKVINAVKVALSKKKPPQNMAAFLKFACAEDLTPEPTEEDKEEAHREYAKQLEREIVNNQYVRVDFMSKAVEFVFLNSVKEPIEVKYSENGFISTVEEYIRKFNLSRRK